MNSLGGKKWKQFYNTFYLTPDWLHFALPNGGNIYVHPTSTHISIYHTILRYFNQTAEIVFFINRPWHKSITGYILNLVFKITLHLSPVRNKNGHTINESITWDIITYLIHCGKSQRSYLKNLPEMVPLLHWNGGVEANRHCIRKQ